MKDKGKKGNCKLFTNQHTSPPKVNSPSSSSKELRYNHYFLSRVINTRTEAFNFSQGGKIEVSLKKKENLYLMEEQGPHLVDNSRIWFLQFKLGFTQ